MKTKSRDQNPQQEKRSPDSMGGLAKGLGIIEAFANQHRNLTITAAAEAVGISKASARRCLLTLADLGYVVQVGNSFLPAPRLLYLGAAYYENVSLPQLAQPHLENARDALQESVSLAVLDGDDPVFVARAEVMRIVSVVARLGHPLPGYASATGRVLLANLPGKDLDAYLETVSPEPLTSHTVTDKTSLKRIFSDVREENVAIVDQELEAGLVSMAVPVKDRDGRTVAAMSVSASRAHLTPRAMKSNLLSILRDHAAALARAL